MNKKTLLSSLLISTSILTPLLSNRALMVFADNKITNDVINNDDDLKKDKIYLSTLNPNKNVSLKDYLKYFGPTDKDVNLYYNSLIYYNKGNQLSKEIMDNHKSNYYNVLIGIENKPKITKEELKRINDFYKNDGFKNCLFNSQALSYLCTNNDEEKNSLSAPPDILNKLNENKNLPPMINFNPNDLNDLNKLKHDINIGPKVYPKAPFFYDVNKFLPTYNRVDFHPYNNQDYKKLTSDEIDKFYNEYKTKLDNLNKAVISKGCTKDNFENALLLSDDINLLYGQVIHSNPTKNQKDEFDDLKNEARDKKTHMIMVGTMNSKKIPLMISMFNEYGNLSLPMNRYLENLVYKYNGNLNFLYSCVNQKLPLTDEEKENVNKIIKMSRTLSDEKTCNEIPHATLSRALSLVGKGKDITYVEKEYPFYSKEINDRNKNLLKSLKEFYAKHGLTLSDVLMKNKPCEPLTLSDDDKKELKNIVTQYEDLKNIIRLMYLANDKHNQDNMFSKEEKSFLTNKDFNYLVTASLSVFTSCVNYDNYLKDINRYEDLTYEIDDEMTPKSISLKPKYKKLFTTTSSSTKINETKSSSTTSSSTKINETKSNLTTTSETKPNETKSNSTDKDKTTTSKTKSSSTKLNSTDKDKTTTSETKSSSTTSSSTDKDKTTTSETKLSSTKSNSTDKDKTTSLTTTSETKSNSTDKDKTTSLTTTSETKSSSTDKDKTTTSETKSSSTTTSETKQNETKSSSTDKNKTTSETKSSSTTTGETKQNKTKSSSTTTGETKQNETKSSSTDKNKTTSETKSNSTTTSETKPNKTKQNETKLSKINSNKTTINKNTGESSTNTTSTKSTSVILIDKDKTSTNTTKLNKTTIINKNTDKLSTNTTSTKSTSVISSDEDNTTNDKQQAKTLGDKLIDNYNYLKNKLIDTSDKNKKIGIFTVCSLAILAGITLFIKKKK